MITTTYGGIYENRHHRRGLGFDFRHLHRCIIRTEHVHAYTDQIKQQLLLVCIQAGNLDAFGPDGFVIMAGTQHQIDIATAQNGLFLLFGIQCIDEGKGFA